MCTVLLLGLLRGQLLWRGWMRGTDAAIGISLLLSAGLMVGLWRAGEVTALQSLAQTVLSLTLVFGIYRVHLVRSAAVPLLARSAVIGVLGAAFVAALHA